MTIQRKLFLRRGRNYLLLMLLPSLLLLSVFLYTSINNQDRYLRTEGQVTISTVSEYCDLTVHQVLNQNDMLSGTTRVLLALRRMLFSAKMSYSDTSIYNMLKATMASIVNSYEAINSIYIWLDDSSKVFSTVGSGLVLLENMPDQTWLNVYQSMPQSQRISICVSTSNERSTLITVVVRLLQQGGCYVLNLDAAAMQKKLTSMLCREEEALYLLNQNDEILVTASNTDASPVLSAEDVNTIRNSQSGTWITLQGNRYLYESQNNRLLRIITLVPQRVLFSRLQGISSSLVTVIILDLLFVVLLSGLVTRKITGQLHNMIDMFDQAIHGQPIEKPSPGTQDEYTIIMNNIAYMYLRDASLQRKMKEETLQKENAELMALQLQINPHFLYNTLQTMDFAILSGNADKQDISDAFHDLSDILRYALSNPQEPVTLGKELEKLRSYVDIQRFRFGNKFVLYTEVDESLLQASVFRMMLQPLV